ncbi:MAG: glycosyltransferase family 2 protein [Deltaproteobacteria bacterium]|nr:glycosyltransferase family 2 protein [Deltaproteobacteria bacterium]
MKPITLLYQGVPTGPVLVSLQGIVSTGLVEAVRLVVPPGTGDVPRALGEVRVHTRTAPLPGSSQVALEMLDACATPFLLEVAPGGGLDLVPRALHRQLGVARSTDAVLTYGDCTDVLGDGHHPHPLPDWQEGSVGEDFPFGPLCLWSRTGLARAMARHGAPPDDLRFHAWYDLRLKASLESPVVHVPEPLCAVRPVDRRVTGDAVFDYLTTQQEVQREAERVFTEHLRRIGAWLSGPFQPFESRATFPVEASVVIPVRNRVRTVGDAVRSALSQVAPFDFNLIVVDNHSTDGTTALLEDLSTRDARVVHHAPTRKDLGIGGCWNEAIFHPGCGRYAIQLDSDDLYEGTSVLAEIVALLREGCGMVVGSYETVDFSLNPIPPGLIDHAEWSDDNGPNNALRVNGLGAPRAFCTELVRDNPFPNVSYGEDYAVALRISREWRVGRIYHSLYHCRRWEGNTDADLPAEVAARHQVYKDRLRTMEIAARRRGNEGLEGAE